MTPLQYRIYEFIQKYIEERGYSPSLADIAEGIGISHKSVSLISRSIHTLVALGKLNFDKKGYRNITLADAPKRNLPLLGRIAAGNPILAIENKECIDLDTLFPIEGHFALHVKGDSMIEEGLRRLGITRDTECEISLLGAETVDKLNAKAMHVKELLPKSEICFKKSEVDCAFLTNTGVVTHSKQILKQLLNLDNLIIVDSLAENDRAFRR